MTKQLTQNTKELEQTGLPVRLLHRPTLPEKSSVANKLEFATKDVLQSKAMPFLALLRKYRFTFDKSDTPIEEPEIISKFRSSRNQPKGEWLKLLTLFYAPANYAIIFEGMAKNEMTLWREVLRNRFVADSDVEKIMGCECFKNYHWGNRHVLTAPLGFFFGETYHKADADKEGQYRNMDTFIYADSIFTKELLQKFFPEQATLRGYDTLPSAANLKCYNGENTILIKLPVLASLYESNQLPHIMGKQTASVAKKAQKALMLPDFFNTNSDSKQAPLSTFLLINYYIFFRAYMGRKKMPSEPAELIKRLLEETFLQNPYNDYTLSVLLPYLKGIKKSKLEPNNYIYVVCVLLNLLRDHHDKNWLAIDQLIMGVRTSHDHADNYFELISPYFIDDMDLRNEFTEDKGESHYIHLGNIVRQLSEPFAKAVFFALSAFGIVEVAYRDPQAGDTSPYDGLQYVRLTELGKFAFGLTESYEPQLSQDQSPVFELDDQRLIIKVVNETSPLVTLLPDYAERITPTLYSVSYRSFLSNCSQRADVEQKVKMFRRYIGRKQSSVWKQFMADVVKHCNPFGIPEDKYIILTIPHDDTELQRLVLSNPSVRRYVLKAENYMLLVKESDKAKLANAMRKLGYVL